MSQSVRNFKINGTTYTIPTSGGSGSGSTVVVTPTVTTGTEIASITVDGVEKTIYTTDTKNTVGATILPTSTPSNPGRLVLVQGGAADNKQSYIYNNCNVCTNGTWDFIQFGGIDSGRDVDLQVNGYVTCTTLDCDSIQCSNGIAADKINTSTAIGSTSTPVYINSNGEFAVCNNITTTDTKNTTGSLGSNNKMYLVGALTQSAYATTVSNTNVYATNGVLTAKEYVVKGSASNTTAKISSDAIYNMFLGVNGKTPLVVADDNSSNIFVAPGSLYSNRYSLGTSSRLWKSVYATQMYASSGFFESSDERLKNFGEKVPMDLDKLSELKKNYFTWKNDENNVQQIGVSAQEIQQLYPELVSEQEDGTLVVAYDKLSVISLAAIDVLHKENEDLKSRLAILEEKILNK